MNNKIFRAALIAAVTAGFAGFSQAQTQTPAPTATPAPAATPPAPLFATTKVDGTDNVYVFR